MSRPTIARSRFLPTIPIAGALTVLSGMFLYWNDSQGFRLAWVLTPTGLTFTLGALAAIAAAVAGTLQGRTAARLGKVADEERPALLMRVARGELATTALLVLAVTAMASARYV